jgi:hypothetical protein
LSSSVQAEVLVAEDGLIDEQTLTKKEEKREREREKSASKVHNRQTWQMSQRGGESGSGRNGTRWCLLTSLFAV